MFINQIQGSYMKIWLMIVPALLVVMINSYVFAGEVPLDLNGKSQSSADGADFSGVVASESNTKKKANDVRDIRFIGAYLKEELMLRSIESYNSRNYFIDPEQLKKISEYALLPVSRVYASDNGVISYEVMYCGKGYVVKDDEIDLSETDKNYLCAIDKDQEIKIIENAREASILYRVRDFDRALSLRDKLLKKGLAIYSRSIYDTSEYTQGTGFKVKVINTSKKTIKYISFTVVGYNSVKDTVRGRFGKTPYITVKGVGPINQWDGGEYNWEYMWFTDLVQTHKITQVKVQYFDGTIKVYGNVDEILLSGKDRYLLSVLGDSDTKDVMDQIKDHKNK
jgi:hypothetical protein